MHNTLFKITEIHERLSIDRVSTALIIGGKFNFMKKTQEAYPHPRKHERKATYNAIQWDHRYRENQGAEIHDISPAGLFLVPLGTMPDKIQANDPIWIVLRVQGKEYFLSATVRWRGMSEEHGEPGFGLEFDKNSKKIAEDLCLEMAETGLFFVPA